MVTVAKVVRLSGPASAIQAADARIAVAEARIASAERGIRAGGAKAEELSAAHGEHLSVTAEHADRIAKLEAALAAAAEAAAERGRVARRGATVALVVSAGTAAAWHWWAPLAAICGAVWRAATGAQ